MERQELKKFLKAVIGPNTELKDAGKWVSASCPFARWAHARGTDSHVSFGVSVNEESNSIFHCWGCKKKGTLSWMLKLLEGYTGGRYNRDLWTAAENEDLGAPLTLDTNLKTGAASLGAPVSDDYLDVYDSAVGHPYLKRRGITDDTASTLDLRLDPKDSTGYERILFPVYSHHGNFYGYTGRATLANAVPPTRDYFGLPKQLLLLGSEFITDDDDFVILVEGLFDFANVFQKGFSVVAALHSELTPGQARILTELSKPIYVFFDDDKAGEEGVIQVASILSPHVPVMGVEYPDITAFSRGSRKPNKLDPAMLSRSQIEGMIAKATLM